MDYPVSGKAPDVAGATVPHVLSGGLAVPVGAASPLITAPNSLIVRGTQAFSGTSYAAGKCIGGKIAIATGLKAGTALYIGSLDRFGVAFLGTNVTASQSLGCAIFEQDPSGSTLADGSTAGVAAADIPKRAYGASAAVTDIKDGIAFYAFNLPPRLTVDAAGAIYVAIVNASAAAMTFAAGDTLYWRLMLGY
jgi:hypothetical protein